MQILEYQPAIRIFIRKNMNKYVKHQLILIK